MAEKLEFSCLYIDPEHKEEFIWAFQQDVLSLCLVHTDFKRSAEEASWPALKGQIFMEASKFFFVYYEEISSHLKIHMKPFLRVKISDLMLIGSEYSKRLRALWTARIRKRCQLQNATFLSEDDTTKLESSFFPWSLVHDPRIKYCNQFMPTKVFNLSITDPKTIDATMLE